MCPNQFALLPVWETGKCSVTHRRIGTIGSRGWKVFLFRILLGKDRWHSCGECCLYQCKFQQAKREEEGSKQGRRYGMNEYYLPGRFRTGVAWMRVLLPIGSQSEDCLERIRRCGLGLIGRGVSLRLAFEVSKARVSLCPLCLYLADKMQALSHWSRAMPACLLPCFLLHWSWTNLWLSFSTGCLCPAVSSQ